MICVYDYPLKGNGDGNNGSGNDNCRNNEAHSSIHEHIDHVGIHCYVITISQFLKIFTYKYIHFLEISSKNHQDLFI